MKFNEKLIELRKKQGLSQEELAGKLNVTRQTISKWELGETTPEMGKLSELSKLFGMTVDALLNEEQEVKIEDEKVVKGEKNKKKLPLPILVLISGIIIGLIVVCIGIYKQNDAKKINQERYEEALKQSQTRVDKANQRLKEIEEEYYPLKEQYEKKRQECDNMDMGDSNWYANHSKCQREASDLHSRMIDLEMENTRIKNTNYTVYYQNVKPMSYQIFYIVGASIAGLAILGAFIIYLVKGKKSYN